MLHTHMYYTHFLPFSFLAFMASYNSICTYFLVSKTRTTTVSLLYLHGTTEFGMCLVKRV